MPLLCEDISLLKVVTGLAMLITGTELVFRVSGDGSIGIRNISELNPSISQNETFSDRTKDINLTNNVWQKMAPRLSIWESGHAVCQDLNRNSICRRPPACSSRNIFQPVQHCRLVNRSVFGRVVDDDIMSRTGVSQTQGICCRTGDDNRNDLAGNSDSNHASVPKPSEEELPETPNLVSTESSDEQVFTSLNSAIRKSATGTEESFDIMPYAALMAQSAHLTNMLLSTAQIKFAGQIKHKNFTQFNIADLGLDCGRRNLTYKMMRIGRIVGGETAGFSDWPWVAMVLNYGRPRCGGTLLSSQAVLTAAHCVSGNMLLYNLTVRIGMSSTNERENLPFPPILLRVKRIIRHPLFDLTTLLNDVAVLQLSQPVTFAPNIMPACIASQEYPYNTPTTILGWGKEEENNTVYELPDSLQAVTVPIINRADCARYFAGQGLVDLIGPQHICAGSDEGGKDACQGDSGGPMLLENPDGRFELLGIISWGFGCGEPHVPGVYTNIFHYRQWIIDTVAALL